MLGTPSSRRSFRALRSPHPRSARSFQRLLPLTMLLMLALAVGGRMPSALAIAPQADLGDAPDSIANHAAASNTAYTGVPGRFPTVWSLAGSPEPSGPRHLNTTRTWLGASVTAEDEADTGADSDTLNNILNGGADNANNDNGDDGWLNKSSTVIGDCRETALKVRISKSANAQPATGRVFLNAWIDGNRDGDWADQRTCPDGQKVAFEWVVRNLVVDTSAFTSTTKDLSIPTMLVLDAKPGSPAWVRFTLSEQPVPQGPDAPPADGRGPLAPNSYAEGETEDYLYTPPPAGTGEPGPIILSKAVSPTGPVNLNSVLTYTVEIGNNGAAGTPQAYTVLSDTLSPDVQLISGPTVTELAPGATPPVAYFDAGAGPRGTIGWQGGLAPQAKLRISFQVKVVQCPPLDGQVRNVHNVARAVQVNKTILNSLDAKVSVNCTPPPPAQLTLEKRILVEQDGQSSLVSEQAIVPGQETTFMLKLTNSANISATVHISDELPLGMQGLEASAERGAARITDDGRVATWDGSVEPGTPVLIKLRARLAGQVRCEDRLINVARWFSGSAQAPSNPVTLRLSCRDLGDAPDSTNHANLAMQAYPNVQASFPTVFDGPVPRGPAHLVTGPLRLGAGVSAEDGADIGFDTDGPHNIEPKAPQADLDQRDDGLARDKLVFADCRPSALPIKVSIDPAVTSAMTLTKGIAFINVWLDSNRDGDWADLRDCPATDNQPATNAPEHIVINMPIDTSKLNGPQELLVPTTSLVSWPSALAGKPAWLRVTLSDRPANKVLPANCIGDACSYGDGRGYDLPFRFGETEDYMVLGQGQSGPADPQIKKRGSIVPDFRPNEGAQGERRWVINWVAEYHNAGAAAANDVRVVDTLGGDQARIDTFSNPPLPFAESGPTTEFAIGTLAPGQAGTIVMRTSVPLSTEPGTVLTNTVTINSSNDSTNSNNTAVVTVTVPLLPPMIVYPTPGTTCESTVTISGRAQPGLAVDIYVDGTKVGTQTASNAGEWQQTVTLANGAHEVYAIARKGGLSSPPSPTVSVTVDSTLGWSPISLHFTDADGRVFTPRDAEGRTDEEGWNVFLRAHTTYTATVRLCCEDPSATVTLDVPSVGTVSLTDGNGDQIFEASFTTGDRTTLDSSSFRICVTCNLIKRCSDGLVLIDPEGIVYDASVGLANGKLADATVSCMQAQTSGEEETSFSLWNAFDFGQENPQTTGTDGHFSFFTPAGTFRLEVERAGYQPFRSDDIVVTDAPVEYNVPLTPLIESTATVTVTIGPNGFEPAVVRVKPGTVIVWVNLDDGEHTVTGSGAGSSGRVRLAATSASDDWNSGLLSPGGSYTRRVSGSGTLTYTDSQNPAYTASVILDGRMFLPVARR